MNNLIKRSKGPIRVILLGTILLPVEALVFAPGQAEARGVARRSTTVVGPKGGVYHGRTTVTHGGVYGRPAAVGGIQGNYLRTLPAGYRTVYRNGVLVFTYGGVYYRPVIQGGQTVYVVTD